MTVKFVLSPHLVKEDKREILEIWENDVMIGCIYPAENGFILLVSKFGFDHHIGSEPIPHIEVQIGGKASHE
jgi:hypothetical protein